MADIRFNESALARLLQDPAGPIGKHTLARGLKVESQAKINASGRPGPNVQTGLLRSSIRTAGPVRDTLGIHVDVGSDVYYSGYVEMGTTRARAFPYLRPALPAAG